MIIASSLQPGSIANLFKRKYELGYATVELNDNDDDDAIMMEVSDHPSAATALSSGGIDPIPHTKVPHPLPYTTAWFSSLSVSQKTQLKETVGFALRQDDRCKGYKPQVSTPFCNHWSMHRFPSYTHIARGASDHSFYVESTGLRSTECALYTEDETCSQCKALGDDSFVKSLEIYGRLPEQPDGTRLSFYTHAQLLVKVHKQEDQLRVSRQEVANKERKIRVRNKKVEAEHVLRLLIAQKDVTRHKKTSHGSC
jgi:hypothetical protein